MSKIKKPFDIFNNADKKLQLDINKEIMESCIEKIVYNREIKVSKKILINVFQYPFVNNINIYEIIKTKENAKKLLEEYKHIQNLIEKEYFLRH